jgi:hypothetical protein
MLVLLTVTPKRKIGRTVNDLREVIRIVQPETVLKWHREMAISLPFIRWTSADIT